MGSPIGGISQTDTELGRKLLQSMSSGSGQVPPTAEQMQSMITNNPAIVNYGGEQTTRPTTPQGAYNTTVNNDLLPQVGNFNFTQPNAPYWGTYTQPMNINPSQTPAPEAAPSTATSTNNAGPLPPQYVQPLRNPFAYTGIVSEFSDGLGQIYESPELNGVTSSTGSTTGSTTKKEYGFDNPAPLPNYSMYIPPSMMPNVNAYLSNPSSLLSTMQNAGIQSAGAGRFSNLLSPNTQG